MAVAAHDIPRMSAAEYLRIERQANCKHEFVNGIVYAMAGASRRHNDIMNDVYASLLASLALPCRAHTSDVQVHIQASSDELYYYPDVVVTCSARDNDDYLIKEPSLIVEVLSRTTEDADRGYKFDDYRKLPSLQDYVFAHQDKEGVEIYRRRTNWQKEFYGPGQQITLESVKQTVARSAFYRRVSF